MRHSLILKRFSTRTVTGEGFGASPDGATVTPRDVTATPDDAAPLAPTPPSAVGSGLTPMPPPAGSGLSALQWLLVETRKVNGPKGAW
eukprot:6675319-Prymnesium_polylepis.1